MKYNKNVSPSVPVDLKDLLKSKVSMLAPGMLPKGYGLLDDEYALKDAAFKDEQATRIVRMNLVWDQPEAQLDVVESVLEQMRGYGAAMVTSAEEVKS